MFYVFNVFLNRLFYFPYFFCIEVIRNVLHGLSKFLQSLPYGSRHFRKFSRTEDEQRDDGYDDHLAHSDIKHSSNPLFLRKQAPDLLKHLLNPYVYN